MRLTRKIKEITERKAYEPTNLDYDDFCDKGCDKLGQLEDIEDEYGIELVTLFKALKRGSVWVREHNTKDKELVLEEVTLDLYDGSLRFRHPRPEIGKARNLFDYGNSWANTKEELE